ncbi:MCE family protein [Amycolatopsis circi]|uniref:MCE family protein n=1 Tax=Amycolatopsis circi TaxID=871959 RepID=UPI0013BE9B25|nr:MCE family protein [Amycolatopsis circi]
MTVLVLGVLTAVRAPDLPIIGDGTAYAAEFSEAAGLATGNDVRIAGVKIGRVAEVSLDGASVRVSFRVSGAWLGDRTSAAIRIKTLLGQKYLALDPAGSGSLDPDTPIPRDRTAVPYDVLPAFRQLATTIDAIDTDQLSRSFHAISETFAHTPAAVRGTLTGLSRLSDSLSARDAKLAHLLAQARTVSTTLADRDAQLTRLLTDGNQLLDEVGKRESAIQALLAGARQLGVEVSGLVADNDRELGPVLTQLDRLTAMLERNRAALGEGILKMAPLVRFAANLTGNGRWIDGYLCGLILPAIGPLNENGCFTP